MKHRAKKQLLLSHMKNHLITRRDVAKDIVGHIPISERAMKFMLGLSLRTPGIASH